MESHHLPTLALILMFWSALLAFLLYLQTLQNALKLCAPASRTMKPGQVWLAANSGFRPYLALRRRNEHYQVIAKRVCKTSNPLPRIDSGAKYRAGVVCL